MILRRLRPVLLLAACAVVGAAAPPLGEARCREVLSRLQGLEASSGRGRAGPEGCVFEDVRLKTGPYTGFEMQRLTVDGPPPADDMPSGPFSVRLHAQGVRHTLNSESAATNWVHREQQAPFDVVLHSAYDPRTRRLEGREISRTLGVQRVALTGVFEEVDLRGGLRGLEQASRAGGVRSLHLTVDDRWFLAGYVLPLLSPALEGDPAGKVARSKARLTAAVRSRLPASGASAADVEAVAGMIRDFPHPSHPVDLRIEVSGPAVTAEEVERAAASPQALDALLRRLRVRARYEGRLSPPA